MTLKEELEILRGEPIEVFTGDPMDIPCIETSDPEKLCKHPVVSVHMITYNHEPYIRQAIEGVMMQKIDFEFELVIGEDASTDKTREICFEYQKRYPDKIRVLWCYENLRKLNHPGGGNSRRCFAHCRGEFIAFCEGDDYWIDPLKLQKQVDVMRKYSNVNLCFCDSCAYQQERKVLVQEWWKQNWGETREISRDEFLGMRKGLITCAAMIRNCSRHVAMSRFEIFRWRLLLGDLQLWIGVVDTGNAFYLNEKMSVYRIHPGGVTKRRRYEFERDLALVKLYFVRCGVLQEEIAGDAMRVLYLARVSFLLHKDSEYKSAAFKLLHSKKFAGVSTFWSRLCLIVLSYGCNPKIFGKFCINMHVSGMQWVPRSVCLCLNKLLGSLFGKHCGVR